MGLTLAEKIIKAHLVTGEMIKGTDIGIRIDQTLTQDATGTMAYLEFEAMGIDRVRMSLFLTEQEDHFRVSVRSKKGTSANRMAASCFHGGGHELAAGGKLYFPADIPGPDDAQAYILKGIEGFFEG